MDRTLRAQREAEAKALGTDAGRLDKLDEVHDAVMAWMLTRRQALRAVEHAVPDEERAEYFAAYKEATGHLYATIPQLLGGE